MTWPSRAPRLRPVNYEMCRLLSYSICYWEVYWHFFRRRGFSGDEFSTGRISHRDGSFRGWGKLSRRTFTQEEFARIHTRNSFCLSWFLVGDPGLHVEMLWWNYPGEIFSEVRILWGIFKWEGDLSWDKSSMGNYHQEILSMGKLSAEEAFHCGGDFWEIFTTQGGGFFRDLKSDQKLNKKEFLLKMKAR